MASLLTEMPNVLDVREVWFTHLLLLGFDPAASEEKSKIHFSRDMFALINKKGMEVVMHFLFSRLNSHLAYEEFRDCWPVYDKKQEQQFRKTCSNWMAKIAKEQPESRLPRLSASLLLSPGGDKFYHFLLRFTSYVLKTVCLREAKSEERQVFLPSFLTSSEGLQPSMREVAVSAMKSHIVRHTEQVIQRLQLATALHEEWKAYACKLISDYRACSKEQRELTRRLASLQDQQKQKTLTGTPKRPQPSSVADDKVLALTHEVAVSKRKSRMKKVRDLWKSVESFDEKSTHQREVVDSILQGNGNKYTFDAKNVVFQIPDLVLQEYEALMREGKVGNTYEAGKLNLTSLIRVWNCAMEVLKGHVLSGEVPSFEREGSYMAGELQAHRAHLAAAQNLRASLLEFHASLEESTRQIEARLQELREASSSQCDMDQQQAGGHQTAPLFQIPPITLPSLGLELMPPSPEKSLVTSPGVGRSWKVPSTPMSLLDDSVSTPEAVHNISRSVQLASQKNANPTLRSSFIPISKASMPPTLANDHTTSTVSGDHLSIFDDSPGSLTKSTYTQSPKITTTTRTTDREKKKTQRPLKPTTDARREGSGTKQPQKSTTVGDLKQKRRTRARKAPGGANAEHATVPNLSSSPAISLRQHSLPSTLISESKPAYSGRTISTQQQTPMARPKNAGSITVRTPLLESMPRAHDILADQIAAAVASPSEGEVEGSSLHTPERELHSLVDPVSAMGKDAFVSKDKIPRTPLSKPMYQMRAMKTRLSPLVQSPVTPQQPEVSKHLPETELLVQPHQHPPPELPPSASTIPTREQPQCYFVTPSPGVTKGMHLPSQPTSTREEQSGIQSSTQPASSRTLSETTTATEGSPHDLHSHQTGMSSSASSSPPHLEHHEETQQSTGSASRTQGSTHPSHILTATTLTVPISPRPALTTATTLTVPISPRPALTTATTLTVPISPRPALTTATTLTVPISPRPALTTATTLTVPISPRPALTTATTLTVPISPRPALTTATTPTIPISPRPALTTATTPTIPISPRPALTTATTPTIPISPRPALTTAVSPPLVSLSRSTVASHPLQSPQSSVPPSISTPHSYTAPVTLASVRKVAFEESQVAAVTARVYTTPTQSPSLFTTVQPPTPFQHANFDLDSSLDNELSGDAESDSDQTQDTGSGEESLLVDLEAAKEVPVAQGDLLGLEEPPFLNSTDLQPTEVITANLLNLNSFHTPSPSKSAPTSSPLVIRTEENLIALETPSRTAPSSWNREQNLLSLSSQTAAPFSNLLQRGNQTSEYMCHGSETSHTTPHVQEGSLQNTWLTGGGSEPGMFEDGSPFLVAPSPMHSMSSHEESLDHSSLS